MIERKSSGKTKPQYASTHHLTHIIICTLTYTGMTGSVGVKHVPVIQAAQVDKRWQMG